MAAPTRVAFDVGPLHGHRTGIGTAVASLLDALGGTAATGDETGDDDHRARPLSAQRAPAVRRSDGVRRLPIPAALAHRLWARSDRPRLDRWFGDVDVVHGTNYVVAPTSTDQSRVRLRLLVPRQPAARRRRRGRAGAVLARRVAGGAHVHTSSHASAAAVRALLDTDRVTAIHLGPPDIWATCPRIHRCRGSPPAVRPCARNA
ncbi:MAG: hypothetical protein WKF58_10220 [Ilumatobacteraceae bacterium]